MSDEIMEIPKLPSRRPSPEEWQVFIEQERKVHENLTALMGFFEKMKGGTLRTCYYLSKCEGEKMQNQVLTEDSKGDVYVAVHNEKMFGKLKRGELVLVGGDPMNGFAIVGRCPIQPGVGTLMTYERSINKSKVEVAAGEGRKEIYWTSQELADQIDEGFVKPGAQLICAPGPHLAFEAVPQPEGKNRFLYLLDEDAPDVVIERDIGAPPPCLTEVMEFFRLEMVKPALRRKYNTRPLYTALLDGPPGTGKTLATKAMQRGMYNVAAEVTGLSEKEIGRRVLKMKASQMLSMWLGESEKAFERFFDEATEIARKPVKVGKKEYVLPVLIIIEEIDSMFRQRQGNTHDAVERIMTTGLQRLDPINEDLKSGIIAIVGTTNEPGLVDRAFLRRIGGKRYYFGMLTIASFPKVLEKHIARLPMASSNGDKQHELRSRAVEELTNLFFTQDNKHIAEIEFKGQPTVRKFRRDFFSGALVDRAVQEAAGVALKAEFEGKGDGIDTKQLAVAFNNQIGSIISQLDERNAHKYVDIPDGEQVSKVRKV